MKLIKALSLRVVAINMAVALLMSVSLPVYAAKQNTPSDAMPALPDFLTAKK